MENKMPTLTYMLSNKIINIQYAIRVYSRYFLLLFMTIANPVYSNSYIPESAQSIVANWTVPTPAKQPKMFIAQLLHDASKPGLASRYYGRANALLKPLLLESPNDVELQFYLATILQHYHQFEQAQKLLSQIVKLQENNVSAWLMKANIHMVQGDLAEAKNACLKLLGKVSLVVSSICALEVNAEQGQIEQSYKQLKHIVNFAGDMPTAQKVWVKQILADLAQRQQLSKSAIEHLSNFPLKQAPVSYLVLWADIHLSQQQENIVLDNLAPIVLASDSFDDALLLRLALAEQIVNAKSSLANKVLKNVWKKRLSQRIEIRLQRNDTAHAADIARYYLDIQPNPLKALHWAKINWQQAKLDSDKHLLERAMTAQTVTEKIRQI
jgi:tetratricopeptide (TPR) repeat protein